MVQLFLDVETNGFGGELISIALVSACGSEFYAVTDLPGAPVPWVVGHVLPVLGLEPEGYIPARRRLWRYLLDFGAPLQVYADWPGDFAHFFGMLSTKDGDRPFIEVSTDMRAPPPLHPKVPHNALSDAHALRSAWRS